MTTLPNEIHFQNGDQIIINSNGIGCHSWIGEQANTLGCWFRKWSSKGMSDEAMFQHIIENTNGLTLITRV
jgi:hypothetical protein